MSGIIYPGQKPFNSYPEKYSYDNWNRGVVEGNQTHIIEHLVKGNFLYLMNTLLSFEPNPHTCHPWWPKKERKYGAKRK